MSERQSSRRSESSRQAIRDATLELMSEGGVAALSMEGIAARAGVGKTTIYRWWPSKGAVAVEALMEAASPDSRFPALGDDLWADLSRLLTGIAGLMSDPVLGPHFAGVIALTQLDPAAAIAFRDRILGPTRAAYHQRLADSRDRGELNGEPDDVLDMAFGPLWYRLLTRPDQLDEEFGRTVAAALSLAFAQGPSGTNQSPSSRTPDPCAPPAGAGCRHQ